MVSKEKTIAENKQVEECKTEEILEVEEPKLFTYKSPKETQMINTVPSNNES